MLVQILRGLFLCFNYIPDVILAFTSVDLIMRDVSYGWIVRCVHRKGASFFFLFLYLHIGRGLYYYRFRRKLV